MFRFLSLLKIKLIFFSFIIGIISVLSVKWSQSKVIQRICFTVLITGACNLDQPHYYLIYYSPADWNMSSEFHFQQVSSGFPFTGKQIIEHVKLGFNSSFLSFLVLLI